MTGAPISYDKIGTTQTLEEPLETMPEEALNEAANETLEGLK